MTLERRQFLQRLGGVLAALGISDAALAGLCDTYQQALARSSRRLALLIGINQYPDSVRHDAAPLPKGAVLQGALMDVELQRELLIHRFGVPATDIMTLVDHQATKQAILEAIQHHLADQAQAGDTVVVHFSGLGSQVHLTDQPTSAILPTLVPVDGTLPTNTDPVIHDLFEETLAQTLGRLQGIRVVTVLDAGAAPGTSPLQGNFRTRSRFMIPDGLWAAASDTSVPPPHQLQKDLSKTWPGLLLRASKPGSPALEGDWNGFSAGAFTYAFTQQIWRSFPAQRQYWIFNRVKRTMATLVGADVSPQLLGQLADPGKDNLLVAGGVPRPAADGIVKTVDQVNKNVIIWLGGLSATLLPYCGLGMRLRPLPVLPGLATAPKGTLSIKTVSGLKAKAELIDAESLPVGTPVVEIERRLPREVSLTVALDPTLERIERVDATSALSGLPYITATASGGHQVDCLFGRFNATSPSGHRPSAIAAEPPGKAAADSSDATAKQPQYGLFSPNHSLIPGTNTDEEEAVKTAVGRLGGTLRNLLAIKLLRLTENPVASHCALRLTLETQETDSQILALEETLRARQFASTSYGQRDRPIYMAYPRKSNQKYQIHLLNLGQQSLYYLIVSVVEANRIRVYCPPLEPASGGEQAPLTADASLLAAGESLTFPRAKDQALSLKQLEAANFFVITCTRPFYETWKAIQTLDFRQPSDRLASVSNALPMAQAILSDLNQASMQASSSTPSAQESTLILSSQVWATLSLQVPTESR